MVIWHFSDTHTYHNLFERMTAGIDVAVFSGDCSNPRNTALNANEVLDFLDWYATQPIQHKIFVAGNHDTSIEARLISKQMFVDRGIHYLENSEVTIDKIKFWGSPFTPTFGEWSFMKQRHKLDPIWRQIPPDTDVLITHGPPKTILDLSHNRDGVLEFCGDEALRKRVQAIQPKLHLFGHIHSTEKVTNAGTRQLSGQRTVYSNGSVVTDNKFGVLTSIGNIFTL